MAHEPGETANHGHFTPSYLSCMCLSESQNMLANHNLRVYYMQIMLIVGELASSPMEGSTVQLLIRLLLCNSNILGKKTCWQTYGCDPLSVKYLLIYLWSTGQVVLLQQGTRPVEAKAVEHVPHQDEGDLASRKMKKRRKQMRRR